MENGDSGVSRANDRRWLLALTLIELLVVVAIIAILASLMLSALQGAKLQAQQTQCVSNLKQLGMRHAMYVDDFGQEFDGEGLLEGPGALGGPMDWPFQIYELYGAFSCPSASVPLSTNSGQGAADKAWAWAPLDPTMIASLGGHPLVCSYTYNGWLYCTNAVGEFLGPVPNSSFSSPNAVRHPSATPVFADASLPVVFPSTYDEPPTNLYYGNSNPVWTNSIGWIADIDAAVIARHGDRPASAAPSALLFRCAGFHTPRRLFMFAKDSSHGRLRRIRLRRANLVARRQAKATGNPPATILVARCAADSPANPSPNRLATAQ
jgi:type II secretory pathway pseudopilin PulG